MQEKLGLDSARIDTAAVHAADFRDANAGAVSMPIYLSTTFERDAEGNIAEYLYSRYDNPNRRALETAMTQLEGGTRAFAFASGLAASMAVLQSLKSGDHVLIPDDAYYGLRLQLSDILSSVGIEWSMVDMTKPEEVKTAIRSNTRLLWCESPSNPLLKVTDLSNISSIAHEAGLLVVCDNTWATPILQQPFQLGCDIIVHSATKYIGGHSDVLLGVVVVKENSPVSQAIHQVQRIGGAVPSPFECWLATRGLQTLPQRIRAASRSAMTIAEYCSTHPLIEKCLYPGLKSDSYHEIASRQMSMYGGMLSIQLRSTTEQAQKVASSMKIFHHATSLGSVESLVEHRRSVEPPDSLTPGNLLRLSIGLESVEDLLEDIDQAIRQVVRD